MIKSRQERPIPNRAGTKTSDTTRLRAGGIVERTATFADRVITLCIALPSNSVGWELGRQLVRAGTSVGANVEESQAAESRADFVHKLKISRKECREAAYFLRRISNAELVPRKRLESLTDEADQLVRMLTSIILGVERNNETATRRTAAPKQDSDS